MLETKCPTSSQNVHLGRACHNLLPTKANLCRKGVCEEKICPICLQEDETVLHVTWECPAATDVWGGSTIKLQKWRTGGENFLQLFSEMISRCDKEDVELFATTARKLWVRRNMVVHGGNFNHPNQVLKEAMTAVEDYQRLNTTFSQQLMSNHVAAGVKWVPPPANTVKVNWDRL